MIETPHLKNVVIFIQTVLSFVLSRKILIMLFRNRFKLCKTTDDTVWQKSNSKLNLPATFERATFKSKNFTRVLIFISFLQIQLDQFCGIYSSKNINKNLQSQEDQKTFGKTVFWIISDKSKSKSRVYNELTFI